MTKHALCRKKSQHLKGRKKRYGYIIAMLSLEEWKNMGLNQHQLLASQRKIPELELNEFLFNEYKTLWKTLLLYETTFTLQMHFCASFHKPKTSSDTKFTHLWQPKPEQTFRKKRSTKVTNCFFSPPPVSRYGQSGEGHTNVYRQSKKALLRKVGKEKGPNYHHMDPITTSTWIQNQVQITRCTPHVITHLF